MPEPINKPNWGLFLLIAVLVSVLCDGGLGGVLFPRLGFEGPWARGVAAAIAGMIIAILYFRMIRRPPGA